MLALMPFRSDKQRRFMYAKHPQIARRWSEEEKVAKGMRFGANSVGRRVTEEVSKGLYTLPAMKSSRELLKGAGEEAAQSQFKLGLKPLKKPVSKASYEHLGEHRYREVDPHATKVGKPGDYLYRRTGYDTTGHRQAAGGAALTAGGLGSALAGEVVRGGKGKALLGAGSAAAGGGLALMHRAGSHRATSVTNLRTHKTYVMGNKRFQLPQGSEVGKRFNDPEERRQRRIGVAEGALATGGGVLAVRNGKPVVRAVRASAGKKVLTGIPKANLGRAGAGVGLLIGAGKLHAWSGSRANRRWQ